MSKQITMQPQPNLKSYWLGPNSIFHCPVISKIMSRRQFCLVNKCLHLWNPTNYVREKNLPRYDKMGQVREVVNSVRNSF